MNTFTISKNNYVLNMSKNNPSILSVKSGSEVIFETSDCFNNQIKSENDTCSELNFNEINPATGPLYVEGAEIGDVLKVRILKIDLDEKGFICTIPDSGVIGSLIKESTKIIPIKNGKAILSDKISASIDPMIGVIGTAPKDDNIPTGSPGDHGGNMDCKRIREGSIIYLPVNTKGALLSMGDLHAIMGDGEVLGCGIEISGKVLVKIDVIKNSNYPLPLVVDKDQFMTIASDVTLDDAHKKAVLNMHEFLCNELKLSNEDSGILLSTLGDLAFCQVVDPLMTCRMEMPIWILDRYDYTLK